jgi:hypothetical protein
MAGGERISCELKYDLGRESWLGYWVQIGVSAGLKELVPEQEHDVFRVHLILVWVDYDPHERGASAMEQTYWIGLTGEYQTTGERARIKPPDEYVDQLLWSVQMNRGDLLGGRNLNRCFLHLLKNPTGLLRVWDVRHEKLPGLLHPGSSSDDAKVLPRPEITSRSLLSTILWYIYSLWTDLTSL